MYVALVLIKVFKSVGREVCKAKILHQKVGMESTWEICRGDGLTRKSGGDLANI